MSSFVITGYDNTSRTLQSGETGYIGLSGELVTFYPCVNGTASGRLTVYGVLHSTARQAVEWHGDSANVDIGASGQVSAAHETLRFFNSISVNINNSGLITGDASGVYARHTDGGCSIDVRNAGVINAGWTGIFADSGAQSTRIVNTGDILGYYRTIDLGENLGETQGGFLVNSGNISVAASTVVYRGLPVGVDRIVNSGEMHGDIEMQGGDDIYRGESGELHGVLFGGDGGDHARGGANDDEFHGEAGADFLRGGDGGDLLFGGDAGDLLGGQDGNDRLDGDNGDDVLRGGAGDDELNGGANNDLLLGQQGDDLLVGGVGRDRLIGGPGDDDLRGGGALDVFVFGRRADNDLIRDFVDGVDLIDLTAFGIRPADYAATVGQALRNAGGSTFLDLTEIGGDGSVLIEGLAIADADQTDFIL